MTLVKYELYDDLFLNNKKENLYFLNRDTFVEFTPNIYNILDNIKNDSFYAGIIEISLITNIFHKTIIVYSIEEQNDNDESNGIEINFNLESDKDAILKYKLFYEYSPSKFYRQVSFDI